MSGACRLRVPRRPCRSSSSSTGWKPDLGATLYQRATSDRRFDFTMRPWSPQEIRERLTLPGFSRNAR